MEIVNIDKLQSHKRIILTGRYRHVHSVIVELFKRDNSHGTCDVAPGVDDYFADYPEMVNDIFNNICHDHTHIIYTNSIEFLDVMLKSKHEFILGTVRQDYSGQLRIRVLTKEEALHNRETFNMELRV